MTETSPIAHRPSPIDYLNPALLAAIASLPLRARMAVEGLMSGLHRSPMQGFSVEFAQHRPYVPGDDLRFLDWKVFARTDKLHLKQYQRETNLDLVLLLDVSGSMGYDGGTLKKPWTKFDAAATLVAALAYMALQQQDRVALGVFAERLRVMLRPSTARDHWRQIVAALSSHPPDAPRDPARDGAIVTHPSGERSGTDLTRLFEQATAKLTQRSLVVLVSDLLDDAGALESGLARLHHRRHDVIVLQVLDPAERTFPFRDASIFDGLEAEGRLRIDPAALRRAYLKTLDEHQRQVTEACRRFRFDHLLLESTASLGPPLSALLARRASAAGRLHH